MAKFTRASQLFRLFKQTSTPTVNQGLTLNDLWVDDISSVWVCSAISPVTFTSIGTGGTPGGANTQIQYNNNSSFGGDSGLTYNSSTHVLTSTGGFVGGLTGNASTVTTNANLTGPVTSTGNVTAIANGTITNAMLQTTPYSSPLTTLGDLNVYGSSNTRLSIGLNGQALICNSLATNGLGYDFAATDPSYSYSIFNDFMQTTLTQAEAAIQSNVSGTGAGIFLNQIFIQDGTGHGVAILETGTTTTGYAAVYGNELYFGNGQCIYDGRIYLDQVSNGTNTFTINFGFLPFPITSINPSTGMYFSYTHSVNSGAFLCTCTNTGTSTTASSSITVVAATWYNLSLIVNATNSSVGFYVNHTLVATITTNIPPGNYELFNSYIIVKSAGTNDVNARIDYMRLRKDYTTRR